MTNSRNAEEHLFEITALAISSLGSPRFYESLLDVLAAVAPHDLAALVRYSPNAAPDLILPRVEPNDALLAYMNHFYRLDPFFRHCNSGGDVGVYQLRKINSRIGSTPYAREFLTEMNIYDEIAVFLPAIGQAVPTLILDRADRAFRDSELMRVRKLYPLLASLHRQHLNLVVAGGMNPSAAPIGREKILRLVDRQGDQVFATDAWNATFDGTNPAMEYALQVLATCGPCSYPVDEHTRILRTKLPMDFGPAPSGFCDELLVDSGLTSAPSFEILPATLAQKLTAREQEVVKLTLRGYPIIDVATRLGLTRGTVKNYRSSIYRKLDITTERELFGEFMASWRDT